MAIKVDILEDSNTVTRTVSGGEVLGVDVDLDPITLSPLENVSSVVTVLAGLQGPQGVQNVFVGPTPPANPAEDTIWIDTSP